MPSGDDGGDATLADVSSEAAPSLDARGDAVDGTLADVVADVVSEDSTVRDVVSEPAVDAPRDVGPDVTPDAPGPTGDGCIATVESCTNGIDDTCDDKIDCADPACAGFTCAAQVPAGWTGPALFWLGASTATPPACPSGYQTAVDGHEGPTGTPDTCDCTCGASGQTCTATNGAFHVDQACQSGACTAVPTIANGVCTAVPANTCGTGGSFNVGGGTPAPAGGSCTPQTTVTNQGTAPGWNNTARVCSWAGPNDTPGGCNPATGQCVGGSPGTGAGFAATVCVFQTGDIACPAGYPNNRNVVFSGEISTRDCGGCACTTASPTGGSCGGTITIFGDANCAGSMAQFTFGTTTCLPYNLPPLDPASVQAALVVTAGTCAVGTPATPTGGVSGTGPTTVCCM
jgi:hypothetical protein